MKDTLKKYFIAFLYACEATIIFLLGKVIFYIVGWDWHLSTDYYSLFVMAWIASCVVLYGKDQ